MSGTTIIAQISIPLIATAVLPECILLIGNIKSY